MRPYHILTKSRATKIAILLLLPAGLALNLFFFHSLIIGITFSILWLVVSCVLWGNIFAPSRERIEQYTLGFLSVLVLVILAGSTYFRLAAFNEYAITAITFFIPLAGYVILFLRTKRQPPADTKPESQPIHTRLPLNKYLVPTLLTFAYLTLFAISINLILDHRTDASIRTPWEVLPHSLLYLYALATFILLFLFSRKEEAWSGIKASRKFPFLTSQRGIGSLANPPEPAPAWSPDTIGSGTGEAEPRMAGQEAGTRVRREPSRADPASFSSIKLILLLFHFFFTLSLALLIYRIGYGFDPFIHRATEKIIFETGLLTPPPLSYLGQYVLVVFLSKVMLIPLPLIDLWLLPVLASILIPIIGIFTLKKYFQKTHLLLITILSLLIIPPSLFIATVPQSLANLFYLILVLLSLSCLHRHLPLSLLWGIAFCIIFIHPITGIPALMLLSYITVQNNTSPRISRVLTIIISILSSLGLPAAIMVANKLYGGIAPLYADALPLPNLIPHYLPFLSLAHTSELWMRALPLLFFIGALAGTYLLLRRKENKYPLALWLTALVLFINYLFIRTLPLTAMIAYERPEFTERILDLIGLTILPLFIITLYRSISSLFSCRELYSVIINDSEGMAIFEAERREGRLIATPNKIVHPQTGTKSIILSLVIFTCLITISFYYTYPRVDAFSKSRGFSVSQTDIDTAHWIEANAGNEPHIVLSNQSIAAAALQEFGFKKYFKLKNCQTADCQTIFYYPIPTSSPLYQFYLNMVYQKASRVTMENAMDLVGVTRAYFVLNSYWLDAEKISARASLDADHTATIGSTKVFVYLKK
ncbi:MAG: hypothetical protein WC659_04800 [Patescibacteria group bacterium]